MAQSWPIKTFALGAVWLMAHIAVARADHLKLGNEGIYPPFSMVDSSGKLTGIEPDLAREMCKRMNAECEFVVMDFKALIPSLLQGKFNALTSQINPLPERKEKALFSIPIIANPSTFVVPAGSNYQFTPDGLKGLKLGVQRGSADGIWALAHYSGMTPVYYDNPDQTRLDLLSKRIDLTFGPRINWTLELINKPEGKDWKLAGGEHWVGDPNTPEKEQGLSWIVRKGDQALLDRMNVALQSMIDDCTLTHIRKQYTEISLLPADAACAAKGS
jgi:arginine/ornithine transport system substrate-binding protein